MNQISTKFARVMVYLAALAALAVCFVLLPELAREEAAANPNPDRLTYPLFIGAYILTIPFFVALYQVHKLLGFIDRGEAFSQGAVMALSRITTCAVVFSILIAVSVLSIVSWTHHIDPTEDAAGFMMLGLIVTFASCVIATFTAVLRRLLRDAIAMKAENDLTV